MKSALRDGTNTLFFAKSEQDAPTLYVTNLPQYAEEFKNSGKGIVFFGSNFVVGLFGDPGTAPFEMVEE